MCFTRNILVILFYLYPMAEKKTIRIAIAEPTELIRLALTKALYEFEILIEASNGRDLLDKLSTIAVLPDVCILELDMPGVGGYTAMSTIKEQWPHVSILVLTVLEKKFNIIYAIQKGAQAYLLKNCPINTLKEAIYMVADNRFYYSKQTPKHLVEQIRDGTIGEISFNTRELLFIQYAYTNLKMADIAARMNISDRTLDGVRDRLFAKLFIGSRETLVLLALKTTMTSDDNNK